MAAKETVGHNSSYFIQQDSIYHLASAWHLQIIQIQQKETTSPSSWRDLHKHNEVILIEQHMRQRFYSDGLTKGAP